MILKYLFLYIFGTLIIRIAFFFMINSIIPLNIFICYRLLELLELLEYLEFWRFLHLQDLVFEKVYC